MIYYLIFGLSYAFACVVQPGPFQAFLFSQSITNGWRKTVPLVFAPLLSDLPVIILVLLLLKNVPKEVLQIAQFIGGGFLLYLAYNAFKSWRTYDPDVKQAVVPKQDFFKAILVNFFNPNPFLSWSLIMGPLLLKGWSEDPVNGIILLISFYSSMAIYSVGIVMLFAAARNFGPKVIRISLGISVIAFAAFGFYQLLSFVRSISYI
ncbi:MAG: lysine exporter protein (LysE/YggA) [uncultured bacterium]|nr:MAG: lysine exporter protein (LysE/YggA) [uncultured bacterium]